MTVTTLSKYLTLYEKLTRLGRASAFDGYGGGGGGGGGEGEGRAGDHVWERRCKNTWTNNIHECSERAMWRSV